MTPEWQQHPENWPATHALPTRCPLCFDSGRVERFRGGPTGEWVPCPCTRKERPREQ
jgi:hypothetical protein